MEKKRIGESKPNLSEEELIEIITKDEKLNKYLDKNIKENLY